MKVLLLTVLLLLLCSTQVLTLRCYTCESDNDDLCKTETDCPDTAQYCKTVMGGGDIKSRTCEEFCAEDLFTTCCQQDLC
ncbi:lymphocyte antigen 6D [Morone saxatilis]|uniref:lymphocyte antigen 6D n=1 Tax=Morone saxatilis TaxID=34816 RepID=UPI0015E1E2F7|nr:lymphocyte antigen 6D [Morone saxatilis]